MRKRDLKSRLLRARRRSPGISFRHSTYVACGFFFTLGRSGRTRYAGGTFKSNAARLERGMLESLGAIVRYHEAWFTRNDDLRPGALELYRDGKRRAPKRGEGCPRLRESARRPAGAVRACIRADPVPASSA